MQLQDVYPIVVTEHLVRCRDFYRQWFELRVLFEASWFVLLGTGESGRPTVAFMHPSHPSAPPGPATFNGKGMCLEFQVDDAAGAYAASATAVLRSSFRYATSRSDSAGSGSPIPPVSGSTWWSR
jgi:hypothetical protein